MNSQNRNANVIGAGPNGLSAAIVLAQAGWQVEVFEAEPQPGGAARTLPLTLPGFLHDFGSAVHPMAAGSPFFSSLPLKAHGLEWIHSPAPLAHPLDDGTAVMLERDFHDQHLALGIDGSAWRKLFEPVSAHWWAMAPEMLQPVTHFPKHPLLMARLGLLSLPSARWLANAIFKGERAKALFAGIAAHSVLSLDEPFSAAAGVTLGAAAHAVGWPIPRGGAQSITNALCAYLGALGGRVRTSVRVKDLAELGHSDLSMCDVTPKQLLQVAGTRFSMRYRQKLMKWRYGPAVFKVDYALSEPIPWRARECLRAATVHIGGALDEIAASEHAMRNGQHSEKPFVLLAQPSLFDPSRAPEGKHIAWAYCHIPNGSTLDMLPRMESQIERFAPGFRECVLDRRVFSPAKLEEMDSNLVGGDISGGAMNLSQFFLRPTRHYYATSARDIYICSSSTPPGGGVHGMCGYNAAKLALTNLPERR